MLKRKRITIIRMIVLVTGGLGFIGSELVRQLNKIDAEIRILDDGYYGKCKDLLDSWKCKYTLFKGSFMNRELVYGIMRDVDYVFHMGALISVADSFRVPADYEHINVQGTIILLEEAAKAGVKGFVFSSSSSVYGNSLPFRKEESLELKPVSPYAMSKMHAEDYCNLFNQTTNMHVSILRYFNVFGFHQDSSRPYAACVATFFNKAMKGEDITIYGSGDQSRSFVHVEDVALANMFCAFKGKEGIYNVGYEDEVSIKELAKKIVKLTKCVNINYEEARDGDVERMSSNSTKLLSTGFRFQHTLDSGLEYIAKAYKQKATLE